jgi:murein DD-endopeptidase MepM/ murein hydrolase activator NlpD
MRAVTDELADAIVIDLPLRGGWVAGTSPADRIPSHGTDVLAQRFAFDFVRLDARGRLYPGGQVRATFLGVPLGDVYGYGRPIHAPFDGVVVASLDGVAEPQRLFVPATLARVIRASLTFRPDHGFARLVGNHVIVARADGVHAAVAHLATGSVRVAEGQQVARGEVLGLVGHTGNSTAPHLHFQLMDSADLMTAKGIPCAFRGYEVEQDGAWVPVANGIPGRRERIRATGA